MLVEKNFAVGKTWLATNAVNAVKLGKKNQQQQPKSIAPKQKLRTNRNRSKSDQSVHMKRSETGADEKKPK